MRKAVLASVVAAVLMSLFAAAANAGTSSQSRLGAPAPDVATTLATLPEGGTTTVIVTMRDRADFATVRGATRAARLRGVIQALRARTDASQAGVRALLRIRKAQGKVTAITPFWVLNGISVTATADVIQELAAFPGVESVTSDDVPVIATAAVPEPNLSAVAAPAVWGLGSTGQGVVVATLDSGVDVSHPDLASRWRGGTNSWFDPYGQHPASPVDLTGHGTGTMGVIVGGDAGGTSIGMAPGARWIAARIFNDKGGSTATAIHSAFQWLLDPDGDPNTADAPHVVSNSWSYGSGGTCNLAFQPDLQALRAAGIVPVFAAGNFGPSGWKSVSPANYPEALAVGAVNNTDSIYSASSRGPSACGETSTSYPEIVAPGVGIRTAGRYGTYQVLSGTSLAAPHVAGALALLLSAHPNLTPSQQESALEQGAHDLGASGPDNTFGFGRLDVLAAYAGASTPDFGLSAAPATVTTTAGGGATYTVTVSSPSGFTGDVSLSVLGLPASLGASLTPPVISGGAGTSQLIVTTSSSTPAGSYPLTITGNSGNLSHTATATLIVSPPPPPPDFALGISPTSATTIAGSNAVITASVTPSGGFTADVTLTVAGLPSGVFGSFTPATVTGGTGTTQLTITTSSSTPAGSYPLTITGNSGNLSHTATATLVITAVPTIKTASPASVTIEAGSAGGGGAAALAVDDAAYYVVSSATSGLSRITSWYGVFTGVASAPSTLKVTFKGKNSSSRTQAVAIWNWVTSSWTLLDSRTVGPADVLIANLVPPGTLSSYVNGGDVRVRVRSSGSLFSGAFTSSGNLLTIVHGP